MRTIICAGFALTLFAGTALAQQSPAPSQPEGTEQQEDAGGPPPPPQSSSDEHDGWGHHMGGGRHRPPSKAAAFRVELGDLRIGMKCPEEEPLKACADFTLQLLDKLGAMQRR